MNETTIRKAIHCPYCGEAVEIFLEIDLEGELVQDCEVCCNPWLVRIERLEESVQVEARTLED